MKAQRRSSDVYCGFAATPALAARAARVWVYRVRLLA
jgi:hypothetical protein